MSPVQCIHCRMKLLDLFTGTGSVKHVDENLGYEVTTLDINKMCNPTVCANVLDMDYAALWKPHEFDIVCGLVRRARHSAARASVI